MQPTHTNPNEPYGTAAGTYNTSYPDATKTTTYPTGTTGHADEKPSLMDKAKHAMGMDTHTQQPTNTAYSGATKPTTYPVGTTPHADEKPSMMDKAKHAMGMGTHTQQPTAQKPSKVEKAKQAIGMGRHGSGSSSSSSDSDNEAKRHTGHTATPAVGTHNIAQPGGAHYKHPANQHAAFTTSGTPTGHESLADKAKHAVGMDKQELPINAGYGSSAFPAGHGGHQTHATGYSNAPQTSPLPTATASQPGYSTSGTQATAYGHNTSGYPTTGTHGTAYDKTGTHTAGYGNTAAGTGVAPHKPTMMEKVKDKVEHVVDSAKGAVGGNKHKAT